MNLSALLQTLCEKPAYLSKASITTFCMDNFRGSLKVRACAMSSNSYPHLYSDNSIMYRKIMNIGVYHGQAYRHVFSE